jgi:D-threo-aldose 1-dehydrogenase
MPRRLTLGTTGVETTALGFGCAGLFGIPSSAVRERLLACAVDTGIRHFDVAPMYGLGRVEHEVGRFARGRRGELVIATKFGIGVRPAGHVLAHLQDAIRRVSGAPGATRAGDAREGALGRALYTASGYGPGAARASLQRSLRALRTDHVDMLLLHDPRPGDVRSDEVRAALEDERTAGRIRTWGVAGEPQPALDAARASGGVPILQVRADAFHPALRDVPDGLAGATITFGVVSRALARVRGALSADLERRQRWSDEVGADLGLDDEIASLLLRNALRENPAGTVLFASRSEERVRLAAEATVASSRPDPALEAFRRLLAELLGSEA